MKTKRKIFSLLLCGAMLFSVCFPSVFAEGSGGTDEGITIGASGLCEHHPEHDADCGYTEGTPCGYVCEICGAEDGGGTASLSNAEEVITVERVQAMIDALPGAEEITEDNAEAVKAQLEAIDEAKVELFDEEIDGLDVSRYLEAAAALEQLLYGTATPSNAVMLLSDYDGPAIVMGTDHLEGGQASSVYFGNYQQNDTTGKTKDPVKWRVLENTNNKLFLLADQNLDAQAYHTLSIEITWENCSLRTWLNGTFYADAFSSGEQDVILQTYLYNATQSDGNSRPNPSYPTMSGGNNTTDNIFLLSIEEVNNSTYFPSENDSRISANTAYVANYEDMNSTGEADFWWLRSPGRLDGYAACVRSSGTVSDVGNGISFAVTAVRPAFNLDLNSVLFTAAAENGKTDTAVDQNLTAVGTGTGEWKLTLKDDSRSFSVTSNPPVTVEKGSTVEVAYTGAGTGSNEYISAMIAQDNTILYYGRVAQNSESGTASITIPDELAPGSYTLKMFSEQYNGAYQTDYASDFVDISLTVIDTTPPTLSGDTANRESEADATVIFTSNEAGTYYFAVVESGAAEAAIDMTGTGAACVKGGNTISLTALTGAGAKDIYIVAKDAAGNVSDPLKITIPVFPVYELELSPASYDFGSLKDGYAAPTAQTVTITNKGNQTVAVTQPTAANYEIGTLSKTELAPGGTATFTVQPKTGFTRGTYSETIAISDSGGATADFTPSFIVTVPVLEVTAPTFDNVQEGYTQPAAKHLTIENTGDAEAAISKVEVDNTAFEIGGSEDTVDVAAGFSITSWPVQPKAGLSKGTYTGTITVTYDNGKTATAGVSFTVTAPVLNVIAPAFDGVQENYTQPEAKPITIENTGDADAAISKVEVDSSDFEIGGSGNTVAAGGSITSWTVQPKAGLSKGTYTGTITVAYDNGRTATAQVSFAVSAPNLIVTAPTFDEVQEGYAKPTAKVIAIENTGDATATISKVEVDNTAFEIGGSGSTIAAGGSITSWTVQPQAGLAIGKYTGTITVTYDNGAEATAIVSFAVAEKSISGGGNGGNSGSGGNGGNNSGGSGGNSSGGSGESGGSPAVYCTLTFETDGGGSIPAVSGSFGETIDLSGYTPAREGCDFNGWYSDSGLTDKLTEILLDGDRTVYAGWTESTQKPDPGESGWFSDVHETDWFYKDVLFVYENGLMTGIGADTFEPYSSTVRAQIARILYRMEGSPDAEGQSGADGASGAEYYGDALAWARQNGIIYGGGDDLSESRGAVTREQFALILYRYARYKGYDISASAGLERFTDSDSVSAWARRAVRWAAGSGIVKGKRNHRLDPQGTVTRAEIAAMLRRFIENYNN